MDIYKIKKGLRLRLTGEAHRSTREVAPSTEYAVRPADFGGITPKVLVKVGDAVLVGTPLFVDKATEQVKVVSPVSGTITAVERGERRKLLSIRIQPDSVQVAKEFELPNGEGDAMVRLLLESGLFAYLRQRPYDVVPTPGVAPRDIFVSAFSSMPLAADFTYVAAGQEEDFKQGIAALAKVAPVHLGVNDEQLNTPLLPISAPKVTVACFRGPNPAGNVGVQINRVAPVNKGETVWTMAPEVVIFLGRLLRTGKLDFTRTIAVGGSEIESPQYARVKVGAQLSSILNGQLLPAQHNMRIINGNPLVGEKASLDDFLGAHVTEITTIPEGDDVHEVLGVDSSALRQLLNEPQLLLMVGRKEALHARLPRERRRTPHDYVGRIRKCVPDGHLSFLFDQGDHHRRHRSSGGAGHLRGGTRGFRSRGICVLVETRVAAHRTRGTRFAP